MSIKVFVVLLLVCATASTASVTNTTVINDDCASGCNSSMFVAVKAKTSPLAKSEAIARRRCKKQCAIPALDKKRLCGSVCPVQPSDIVLPKPACVLCGGNREEGIAACLKSLNKVESSCGFKCDNNVVDKLFAIHENKYFFTVSGSSSVSQVFPGVGRC